MNGGKRAGVVTFSVDLELNLSGQNEARQQMLDRVGRELMDLFDCFRIAATFALADPAHSVAAGPLSASLMRHEIAVLGEDAWVGCGSSRSRLDRELARRFEGARKAGYPVSTLALRCHHASLDPALLDGHGITAVRGPAVNPAGTLHNPAPTTRHGAFQPQPPWRHPLRRVWWSSAGWRSRRVIWQSLQAGETLHLYLDGAALAVAPESAIALVAETLSEVSTQRERGRLRTSTIADSAREFHQEHLALPSRSVLRAA